MTLLVWQVSIWFTCCWMSQGTVQFSIIAYQHANLSNADATPLYVMATGIYPEQFLPLAKLLPFRGWNAQIAWKTLIEANLGQCFRSLVFTSDRDERWFVVRGPVYFLLLLFHNYIDRTLISSCLLFNQIGVKTILTLRMLVNEDMHVTTSNVGCFGEYLYAFVHTEIPHGTEDVFPIAYRCFFLTVWTDEKWKYFV